MIKARKSSFQTIRMPWQISALCFGCLLMVLYGVWPVSAAKKIYPDYPQSPYQFDSITVDDGLSNDRVHSILQTSDGFMWFGTESGLNQYNGYDFVIFTHNEEWPDSLQNNRVNALLQDREGGIWVGTDHGLDLYSAETGLFSHYLTNATDPGGIEIKVLYEDRQGNIWVGTADAGIKRFDPISMQFQHYRHERSNSLSINSNHITAINEDTAGRLWVGTDQGLNLYDAANDQFSHFVESDDASPNYPIDPITSIIPNHENGLWLGTDGNGLILYTPGLGAIVRYRSDGKASTIASDGILSLLLDSRNQLWIGMDKGLDKLDPLNGQITHLQNAPQDSYWIHNAEVRCLVEDKAGMIWIASAFGGVSKYDPNIERFTLMRAQKNNPQSISGNDITGITETEDGVLWISTYGDGISLYNRQTRQFSFIKHNPIDPASLASDTIRTMMQSSDGYIWVGTVENGLDRYQSSTRRFTHFIKNEADESSLSENSVTALFEDHAGRIWIGTYSQGLNLVEPAENKFIRYQHEANNLNSILDDHILAIYEDDNNFLWVGTWNGITVFSPDTGEYRHYQNNRDDELSLSSNMIFSFYQSSTDIMWIGTNGGGVNLFDMKANTFRQIPDSEGILNIVYAILSAPDGTLWFSTNQGIIHYDPYRQRFRSYDERDGLQGNGFNVGAYYQNSAGELFFGGPNGLNIFQPQKIYEVSYVPPIAILSIRSGNQIIHRNITSNMTIELPQSNANITFEFGMLDYSDAEKNEYAYQLVGFDEEWINLKPERRFYDQDNKKNLDQDWHYIGARRTVSYSDLPDGRYTFRVKGSNDDLIWDSEGLSINVLVKPPFWKTAWFPITLVLITIGIFFMGNIYRSRRIAEVNRVLENQVKERTYEIEQKREVAEGLRDILAFINSDQSLDEILGHLARRSIRLMKADACVILEYDEDILIHEGSSGLDMQILHDVSEVDTFTFMQQLFCDDNGQEPQIYDNLQKHIRLLIDAGSEQAAAWHRWQLNHGLVFHGLISFPIRVRGEKNAGILFYFYMNANPLIRKPVELTELGIIFADQGALAMENALLRQTAEMNAVAAERNRIARDLHDAVTQTLFSANLVAEVLPRVYKGDMDEGNQMLKDLQQMTRGALAEMRTLLIELRPTSFSEMPLSELVRQLTDSFVGKLDLPLQVNIKGSQVLAASVQTAVFRVAQETLNNIQKHGMASLVRVKLDYDDKQMLLEITDNGCGFDSQNVTAGHFGLQIMRERAQAIGAFLKIESKINCGTTITLEWKAQENKVING
jgi:signal transduction histidine kinase/ligand-binding sensor domain-containing protein